MWTFNVLLILRIVVNPTNGILFQWPQLKQGEVEEGRYFRTNTTSKLTSVFLRTQCAMKCMSSIGCSSYNFCPENHTCELNSFPKGSDNLTVADGVSYYELPDRDSVQPLEGLCVNNPCQHEGYCLNTRTEHGAPSYLCVCTDTWRGNNCELQAEEVKWSEWQNWQVCSASCGQGSQMRRRQCSTGSASTCYGADIEYRICNDRDCPRWGEWSTWSNCSTLSKCGRGKKHRQRNCLHGGSCQGPFEDSAPCEGMDCTGPMKLVNESHHGDGIISIYNDIMQEWTFVCSEGWNKMAASIACRQLGFRDTLEVYSMSRRAVSPTGAPFLVVSCIGDEVSLQHCDKMNTLTENCGLAGVKCIVDGAWDSWQPWQECSVTCGNGTSVRTRQCTHPPPLRGGQTCQGDQGQEKPCHMSACPVDGVWLEWNTWTSCPVSCGGGIQNRHRSCSDPAHGGKTCTGNKAEERPCNEHHCPVEGMWREWSVWTNCSKSCGTGSRTRRRACEEPLYGGHDCTGPREETDLCNTHPCPVDGSWKDWSEWSRCTKPCGNGTKTRSRECNSPLHGGTACTGPSMEAGSCNTQECGVNGTWHEWESWTSCSASCGGGKRTRKRSCYGPFFDGHPCTGPDSETGNCSTDPCPVDGRWLPWGSWGPCDVTCGNGSQERFRECTDVLHGGVECSGNITEVRPCNPRPCPVDGVWKAWGEWQGCDLTCGGGKEKRERNCIPSQHGGRDCEGADLERRDCNEMPCPAPGMWTIWSTWGSCDAMCGGGVQIRHRNCDATVGRCEGESQEKRDCNKDPCPVDGVFREWSPWSDCSDTCGGGMQYRSRTCDGPYFAGTNCTGDWSQERSCNDHHCPVDGVFTAWSLWDTCTVSCGGGIQRRSRLCDGPKYNGANCSGPWKDERPCNTWPCPIDGYMTEWSKWTECSVNCGGGEQERDRTCVQPQYGGQHCHGVLRDFRTCNIQHCPVDGQMKQWSEWTECSVTCGGGAQERNRTCVPPQNGGQHCHGELFERRVCNILPCPADGFYTDWTMWGQCDVTCGGGYTFRTRTCHRPLHGGLPCLGEPVEKKTCNEHPCPIHGYFTEWEKWTSCNVTCAGGMRTRNRTCVGPYHEGEPCQGERQEIEHCNQQPCPIPVWSPWSSWSRCSKTCGQGVRYKSRTCNVYNKCPGNPAIHIRCNSFPCDPAISCEEWRRRGLSDSTDATVDPDGPDGPMEPFPVFCNLTEGVAYSIIGHDSEGSLDMQGFEGAGEGFRFITYSTASVEQLSKLVDISGHCEQFLSWKCFGAAIHHPEKNMTLTYWLNRAGKVAHYWSGAPPGSGLCACGVTDSCEDNLACNCDKNDAEWREDSGLVTYRDDLPITGVKIGDTGSEFQPAHLLRERGVLVVGKLICHG